MGALGIDVSSLDGTADWAKMKSRGIEFATIRGSWNLNYYDLRYKINMAGALEQDIKRISYHWYVPRKDPRKQAEFFVENTISSELPRMIDLEDSPRSYVYGYRGIVNAELKPFFARVKELTGEDCIVYTSPSYIQNYFIPNVDTWIGEHPLIIAHYQASAPTVYPPWIQTRWLAWQTGAKYDGNYYGFPDAKEAALYVWNGDIVKI